MDPAGREAFREHVSAVWRNAEGDRVVAWWRGGAGYLALPDTSLTGTPMRRLGQMGEGEAG